MSVVRQNSDSPTITKGERNFGICVLLAVAYGASIGGMGTIIGSLLTVSSFASYSRRTVLMFPSFSG